MIFGTFASDETRSIWEYVKNIYDQNPDIVAIDFHGGWSGEGDDEEIAPCVSGPTTMVGHLGKNGIPAMLIELSYINAYDNEKDAVVQLSQPLLKRIAARMPHAIDKAFNM